ncbi:MAG: hypothetical protein NTX53_08380 [candidate division WOR-3 bacterium]|nr:hypothetical protein [candidate division WOR-3 bacterium]
MIGRFLFRSRGVIGLAAFVVVFWLARPTVGSCSAGLAFVLAGLAVRFWASGYIGIEGRAREIGASRRIASGPYRLLRHPLYIGNFLLVAGMVIALRPPLLLMAVVLVGFCVEYAVIVVEEERDLSRGRGQRLEARRQNAEVLRQEAKSQEPKAKTANGDGREANGEQFTVGRAMCEWRTWVVTGVAFGLAVAKAAARS